MHWLITPPWSQDFGLKSEIKTSWTCKRDLHHAYSASTLIQCCGFISCNTKFEVFNLFVVGAKLKDKLQYIHGKFRLKLYNVFKSNINSKIIKSFNINILSIHIIRNEICPLNQIGKLQKSYPSPLKYCTSF